MARFHLACPRGTRILKTRVPHGHATWNLATRDAETEPQRKTRVPRGHATWNLATRDAETEPQRLDFGPLNRASEARVANNEYSFKTGSTN